ncbi:TRAP transporter substrate-binding protein DctP [Amorphus orientalis]|uniref:TRAP-type C4-dicarboxylate transport system substrate-binding protein n=1 Tax=Amorphus orientalis TaxID=649198 RepID=A0AAE3VMB9_9HYPH|nr:TRAP transporter substrate-binding protein DctP [Amorphus orientalis]MDQ0314316.1 TRAP-type C4-dicarboxylate transport system substrate-binding protein [Amorphus orientalis]
MKFAKLALSVSAATLIAGAAHAETLTIQTSFNAGDFSTKYLTENWLPKIQEMTDGRIEIELTPSGSVVPSRDTPEAVAAGVIDGDFTSVNYFAGLEPAYAIMGDLISGYDTPEQMLGFCRDGGGEAMMQKAADSVADGEVTVVACGPYSREALVARVPIRTFEDLEGKKIRSPEGLAAAVFQAAGASPVAIPFSEVFGALEKGIVDAADASAYVNNDATGLHDVAPYPLYPGIHSMPSMQFTVNTETWESLSEEDQAALRKWWYDAMYAMAAEVSKKDQELAARDDASEDIEVIDWAQEDRDQLREVAREQWKAYAQKSELAQEALQANLDYMKEIGLFKD